MSCDDYTKEQLAKMAVFLRGISTPVEKKLNHTESEIALVSAKYLEDITKRGGNCE